jgi:hypothetical protein
MAQAQQGQKPAEPQQLKTANDLRRFVDDLAKSNTQESLPADWRYSIAPFNPPTKIDVEGSGSRFVVLKKDPSGAFKPALMKGEDIRTVWESESAVDFDQKLTGGKSLRDLLTERMGGAENMKEVLRVADPVFLEMINAKGPDGKTRISIADLSQRGHFSSSGGAKESWVNSNGKPMEPQPIQVFTIRNANNQQVVISTNDPRFSGATREKDGLQGYIVAKPKKPGDIIDPRFADKGGDVALMANDNGGFSDSNGRAYDQTTIETEIIDPVVTALQVQSRKITDFTTSKFETVATTNVAALLLSQLEPRAPIPLNPEPVKPAAAKPIDAAPGPSPMSQAQIAEARPAAPPVEKRDATPADIERLKLKSIPTDPAAAEDAMYENVKSIVEAHRTMNFTPDQIRTLADQYKPENFYNNSNFQGVSAYKNTLKHIADDPYLLRNDSTINTELTRIESAHESHMDDVKSAPVPQAQVELAPVVAPAPAQNTPAIDADYLARMKLPENLPANPYERQTAINRAAFTVFGALKDGSIPENQKDSLINQFEKKHHQNMLEF